MALRETQIKELENQYEAMQNAMTKARDEAEESMKALREEIEQLKKSVAEK